MTERDLTDIAMRYLDGNMSPKEEKDFEVELETNKELREELEFCRKMQELEIEADIKALDDSPHKPAYMDAIREIWQEPAEVAEPTKPAAFPSRRWLRLIAILLLCIAGGFAVWYLVKNTKAAPSPLAYGVETIGRLTKGGKEDTYLFQGKKGDTLIVQLQGDGLALLLTLLDSAAVALASTDSQSLRLPLPSTGNFLLRIAAKDGTSTGSYRLKIERIPPPVAAQQRQPTQEDQPPPERKTPNSGQGTQQERTPRQVTNVQYLALATKHLNVHLVEDFETGGVKGGQDDGPQKPLELANEAFDSMNWQRAIALYEQVRDLYRSSSAYTKLGMAYLQTDRPDSAIAVFKKVKINAPSADLQRKAQWYLLLAYLAGGEQYREDFEAELKAALDNPKMKERFMKLAEEYNDLLLLPVAIFAAIGKEDSLSVTSNIAWSISQDSVPDWVRDTTYGGVYVLQDSVPDWMRDTAYANRLLKETDKLFSEEKYEETLLKLDTVEQIIVMTEGEASAKCGAVLRQKALAFEYQFLYDTAIVFYQKAISIQINALGLNHPTVAKTYSDIAACLNETGDYLQAEEYLNKALTVFLETFGIGSEEVATVYKNLSINKYLVGEYEEAIDIAEKCLAIELKLPNLSQLEVAKSFDNLGAFLYLKGDYDKGIEMIKKALEIRLRILGPEDRYVAQSYSNMGSCLVGNGDFNSAIEYFEKAMTIIVKTFGADHPYLAGIYNNLGSCNYLLGDFDTAIEFHEKALTIRIGILGEEHTDVAGIIENLGNCYAGQGNYQQAIDKFKRSLEIENKVFGTFHPYVAQCFSNLANSYLEMNEYDLALENHQQALTIWLKTLSTKHKHPYLALAYNNLGNTFLKKGDYKKALDYFQQALEANDYNKRGNQPALSNEFLLQSLNLIGSIYLKPSEKQNIKLAISTYFEARQGLSHYRQSLLGSNSKERLSDDFLPIYSGSIAANLLSNEESANSTLLRETFIFAEQGKSLSLYEAVQESNARSFGGVPDSLLQQEHELRVDIAYYEKKRYEEQFELIEEKDSILLVREKQIRDSLVAAYGAKVFDKRQQLEALVATFGDEYRRLKYDISTITLDDVQDSLLQDKQTLLEYFVGDSSIFIFVVKKDDYQVIEVKKDFPLKDWVAQMRGGIEVVGQEDPLDSDVIQGPKKYATAAHNLYKKLVAPVEALLDSNVIIIPDGELGWLPFEALLTKMPVNIDSFRTYPYLLHNHSISYAPSATMLREMQKGKSRRIKPNDFWLGLAPFSDSPAYPVLDSLLKENNIANRRGVRRLTHSGEEVAMIARLTNGQAVYDAEASSEFFKKNAPLYRILHLSQHGQARTNIGDYSYLLFPDTLLYVRDIYNLQLNADMVVLSACETGYGELRRGEGIIGMTRAFTYAGAKSLFATLWSVSDEATRDVTVNFYKHLLPEGGKLPKDQALREAKLGLISGGKFAHPYYWAGMIGIGDMRPLELEK